MSRKPLRLPAAYTSAHYQQARQVVRWYNRRIACVMRLPDQARSEAIRRTIALLEEWAARASPLVNLQPGQQPNQAMGAL